MTKLLINESPLQVLPSLVRLVGLSQAIILQQIQYLVQSQGWHDLSGRRWYTADYAELSRLCGKIWEKKTLSNYVRELEEEGFLLSEKFDKSARVHTKSYRIDYSRLEPSIVPDSGLSMMIPDSGTSIVPDSGLSIMNNKDSCIKENKREIHATPNGVVSRGFAKPKSGRTAPQILTGESLENWLAELQSDLAYQSIPVRMEYAKMLQWCRTRQKQPTKRRFIAWLNRIDNLAMPVAPVEETPEQRRRRLQAQYGERRAA